MLQNHTLQLLQVAAEIQQRRQELLRERLEPQIQTIQAYLGGGQRLCCGGNRRYGPKHLSFDGNFFLLNTF